jgi:hypothetical protein
MRKLFIVATIALCLFVISHETGYSWGFFAHKRINRMAVFTLPPQMIGFYKSHIEYITDHAVDPDSRRYSDEEEACRHYIDLDHYGAHPFDSIPKWWKDAVAKYSEDTLKAYGIVPWHIDKMVYRLTEAFKEKNSDKILYLSADLGHYIGDAHVPLHTTENYNGQLTGQKGIHGFWESRIPELKADGYDYFTGRAKYIEHPVDAAWNAVKGSFVEKDSVLLLEADLNKRFPTDRKYGYDSRGNQTVKTYSEEYTGEYDKLMNGMVERRMRAAIELVGSLWYTAWVDAGQPDLSDLDNKPVSDSLLLQLKTQEEKWRTGKLKNPKGHED